MQTVTTGQGNASSRSISRAPPLSIARPERQVDENESEIPAGLAQMLATIDRMYPQLRIDFVAVKGRFGPELIDQLSKRLHVPKNSMFIATPGDRFPHQLADLGGVRVIL